MFLFLTDKGINLFEISLIISSGENTWRITEEKIQVIPISNYEKFKSSQYQTMKKLAKG